MKTVISLLKNLRIYFHMPLLCTNFYLDYPSSFELPNCLVILVLCYFVGNFTYEQWASRHL